MDKEKEGKQGAKVYYQLSPGGYTPGPSVPSTWSSAVGPTRPTASEEPVWSRSPGVLLFLVNVFLKIHLEKLVVVVYTCYLSEPLGG
jgi:hypothetical protein